MLELTDSKLVYFRKKIFSYSTKIITSLSLLQERAKILESYKENDQTDFLSNPEKFIFKQEDIENKNNQIKKEEAKAIRAAFVEECNALAAHIVQFDNTLEQLFIFLSKKEGKIFYKNIIIEDCGIKIESWENTFLPIRSLRNTLCHSYAFHKIFAEMKSGKLGFFKFAFRNAKIEATRCIMKFVLIEKLKNPGFVLNVQNNEKTITSKKTVWVSSFITS